MCWGVWWCIWVYGKQHGARRTCLVCLSVIVFSFSTLTHSFYGFIPSEWRRSKQSILLVILRRNQEKGNFWKVWIYWLGYLQALSTLRLIPDITRSNPLLDLLFPTKILWNTQGQHTLQSNMDWPWRIFWYNHLSRHRNQDFEYRWRSSTHEQWPNPVCLSWWWN